MRAYAVFLAKSVMMAFASQILHTLRTYPISFRIHIPVPRLRHPMLRARDASLCHLGSFCHFLTSLRDETRRSSMAYFVDSSSEYSDMSSEEEIRPAVKAGSKRPTRERKPPPKYRDYEPTTTREEEKMKKSTL